MAELIINMLLYTTDFCEWPSKMAKNPKCSGDGGPIVLRVKETGIFGQHLKVIWSAGEARVDLMPTGSTQSLAKEFHFTCHAELK